MQQVESQSIPIVNSIPRPTLLSHTQTINQPTKHPPAPPFTPSVQARPQLRNRNLRLPASFPAPARWPGTTQAPPPFTPPTTNTQNHSPPAADPSTASFDAGLTGDLIKEIAARKPLRALFRDDGFDNTPRINVEQIFKLVSPATEVKAL